MFGGDPFGDPFSSMRRQMREMDRMMEAMMEPFGMPMDPFFGHPHRAQRFGQNMLEDGQPRRQIQPRRSAHEEMDMMMSPFGGGLFGGGLFSGVNNLMQQMEGISQRAMNDPNAHVYTQSTMISFDGNGPRVVQESVRKAGDVKETRRSVQNGMQGEAEMEVGHHVGNRSHIIEKKRDKDGRMRQQQKFVNLNEDDAEDFNHEFKTRAQTNLGNLFKKGDKTQRSAIENGSNHADRPRTSKSSRPSETSRSSTSFSDRSSGSGGDHAPIVTIPDDDEEYGYGRRNQRGANRREDYYYPSQSGPTIREISEEEADMSIPKRRKGGR